MENNPVYEELNMSVILFDINDVIVESNETPAVVAGD